MQDWKIKQEIYHRLNQNHRDDLSDVEIVITQNTVDDAVRYFVDRDIGWIYPSKSYMVAICYSRWLAEHWGGQPTEYLDDPQLLYGNDPYFVEYSRDPHTYHNILNRIGGWQFDTGAGMVPDVREYFNEEFMIDQKI
jgi:hypothetical protein